MAPGSIGIRIGIGTGRQRVPEPAAWMRRSLLES